MSKYYPFAEVEPRWQQYWDEHKTFRALRTLHGPSSTASTCSRTRRAPGCTSVTSRATRRPTSCAATSACAASTCCMPPAGTRSACPPSSTRSRPAIHPAITTTQNIDNFRRQMKRVGLSHDWDREVDTTDPELLPLDAVDLPQALRARAGLRRRGAGQLVPRARHGAGERGGRRRQERGRRLRGRPQARCASGCSRSPRTPTACSRT